MACCNFCNVPLQCETRVIFCGCGGCSLAMSTSQPNPSVSQSVAGGDGGASNASAALNAIGKWGTALTGIIQGKPVATTRSGVAVGARGSSSIGGGISTNTLLLILVIIGALIFVATRK